MFIPIFCSPSSLELLHNACIKVGAFCQAKIVPDGFPCQTLCRSGETVKRDEYWKRQKRWILGKTVTRRMDRDFIKPRKENERSIFAQVEYECDGFLHKNRDTVMEEQVWFHIFWRTLFQVFDIFRSRSWKPPRTTLSPIFSFLKVGNRRLYPNPYFQPLVHKEQNWKTSDNPDINKFNKLLSSYSLNIVFKTSSLSLLWCWTLLISSSLFRLLGKYKGTDIMCVFFKCVSGGSPKIRYVLLCDLIYGLY